MEKCPHKRERHWYKNEQNICNNTKYELYSINCYFGSFVVKVFSKACTKDFFLCFMAGGIPAPFVSYCPAYGLGAYSCRKAGGNWRQQNFCMGKR